MRRDQRQLVAGMAHGRGDEVERMGADGERDRQLLAARHAGRVDALEIGRRGDVGAGLVAVAQAEPAAADVPPSGRRIDHVVGRRAQVATAVVGVVRIERQLGEIDVLAGDLHGVHRRVAGRNLHHRLRIGQALEILVVDFFFGGVERGDQALAAGRGLGHDLGLFRAGLLEQHRLLGALDDRAERRSAAPVRRGFRPRPCRSAGPRMCAAGIFPGRYWRTWVRRGHRTSRHAQAFNGRLLARSHRIPACRASVCRTDVCVRPAGHQSAGLGFFRHLMV